MGLFIYLLENTDLSKPRHPRNGPAMASPQESVRVGVSGKEESNQNFAVSVHCSVQGCMKCTCSFGENWKQGI